MAPFTAQRPVAAVNRDRSAEGARVAGVPATGAAVRLPYSVFYDISDGKILALRVYFPITALLHQLREAASAHA